MIESTPLYDSCDYMIEDHGSIIIIQPLTGDTHDLLRELVGEDAMWCGSGLAVEPRYVPDLVTELESCGFQGGFR